MLSQYPREAPGTLHTPTHPLGGCQAEQPHLSPPAQHRGKALGNPLCSNHCGLCTANSCTTAGWELNNGLRPPEPAPSPSVSYGMAVCRGVGNLQKQTQILQTDARGKETNAELFNNMEREILIAAFHKTTSLLPSPSLEKASQFCFYISHPQGRTIPTSPMCSFASSASPQYFQVLQAQTAEEKDSITMDHSITRII